MRVYDIALMYVRAIAAIDVVRAIIQIPFNVLGVGAGMAAFHESPRLATEAGGMIIDRLLLGPATTIVMAIVLLVLAKPIARFAAKFAATTDAASHF
jgi:hypothetical protein